MFLILSGAEPSRHPPRCVVIAMRCIIKQNKTQWHQPTPPPPPMDLKRDLHTPNPTANPIPTLFKSSASLNPEGCGVRIISRRYKTDTESVAGNNKEMETNQPPSNPLRSAIKPQWTDYMMII